MLTGTCLCGACEVTIQQKPAFQVACHCTDCHKVSGGAFTTNLFIPPEEVESLESSVLLVDRSWERKAPVCPRSPSVRPPARDTADDLEAETGIFPECTSLPFYLEVFAKDRFDKLSDIAGAKVSQITPSVEAKDLPSKD
ncbi:hypothetical protein P7C73_g3850, partial [Tremellales sp. Uapishka_1]